VEMHVGGGPLPHRLRPGPLADQPGSLFSEKPGPFTGESTVESIRRWWWSMGYALYPQATRLLITADAGGSNGYRLRLWKIELQRLADETRLEIAVCHFPPGTSKWNKIEHRLFSAITQNWRGKPLVSHEVVVNLI